MAAHPIVVIDDELLEKLPARFKSDPRYKKGASLELVPVADVPKVPDNLGTGDWRKLEGILAIEGKPFSATELKREQREWELAHDGRKFGVERPSW